MIEDALSYVARGWHVVALHHVEDDGSCSCGDPDPDHAIGKHPRERGWQNNPALSAADVHTLWDRYPHANVGIATGERSGIFVVDVDPKNGGMEALAELEGIHGPIPDDCQVTTGSNGWHFYFQMPDFHVGNSSGRLPAGIDIRGTGGQVVAPPSVSGVGPYRWESDGAPPPAPEWLLELIRPQEPSSRDPGRVVVRASEEISRYVSAAVDGELRRVMEATEDRNITLNRATFSLASIAAHEDSGLQVAGIRDMMREAGMAIGLGKSETYKTVESAISGGLDKPRQPWPPDPPERGTFIPFDEGAEWPQREWDDLGNADRLVDHCKGRILWVLEDEAWSVYDGSKWQRDQDAMAQALAQKMIGRLPDTEAHSYSTERSGDDPSPREQFAKFVSKQRSAAKIAALLRSARGLPELHASAAEFDRHRHLLNLRNGTLNLADASLQPHDAAHRFMLQADVDYDPYATCPTWTAFLERTQPDQAVREFLQRAVGYTLIGAMSEQVMFLHHGVGANGKSVFLSVLGSILGDYSQIVPRQTLLVKQSEGVATDIARMVGRRLLQTSETAAGRRMDEEVIKSITGGDRQVARHLYGREFEFSPQGTIHYATNHLPRLTDAESIWRRLVLIKWGVTIPETERDGHLPEKIAETEGPGVLAWAVRGALRWQESGLQVPLVCQMALDEFREDSNIFGDFLRDETVSAPGTWTSVKDLYAVYSAWCARTGSTPMIENSFGNKLKEEGYHSERRRVDGKPQRRGYIGIAPRENREAWW